MQEEYKELIQEWFSNCCSNVERAELYAELLCEIRKQLGFCMEEPED